MEKLRAQEVRTVTFGPNDEIINEVRDAYVDHPPEEIANKVLDIVGEVVGQHAARQRANSRNTGRFSWQGVAIDLTVPQLRTLQEAYVVLTELVNKLPRRNPKLIPNTTVEGRPAFAHQKEELSKRKAAGCRLKRRALLASVVTRKIIRCSSTSLQVLRIDYGMDVQHLEKVKEPVLDLGTAIQVAIDDANSKGHEPDPAMEGVIESIKRVILASLPPSSTHLRNKPEYIEITMSQPIALSLAGSGRIVLLAPETVRPDSSNSSP